MQKRLAGILYYKYNSYFGSLIMHFNDKIYNAQTVQ